jgi:cell shape-determining protein MreC
MKNFSFKTRKNFRPDSARGRILKILLVTGVAVLSVFVLRSMVGSLTAGSIETVMRIREYFAHSSAALPLYIRSRGELDAEIQGLKQELAAQSGSQTTVARLVSENEELRALLGDTKDERILAGVIGRPPHTPYDTLVIDRGSIHDMKEGAIVYHTNEHAIGMVTRVYEKMALVTLFSSNGVESTVYVYGPDVFAYAYGEGGGVIRISLPQGIAVKEGDVVVLPSLHMGDIGIVERVVSLSTQPEQNAYLTFPIPIQSFRTVSVGKEPIAIPTISDLESGVERLRERFRVEVSETARLGTGTTTNEATSTPQSP